MRYVMTRRLRDMMRTNNGEMRRDAERVAKRALENKSGKAWCNKDFYVDQDGFPQFKKIYADVWARSGTVYLE